MMKQRTTTTVPVSFFPIRHVNCRPTVSINWNSLFIVSTSCRHLSIHHHHHHHLHGTVKQQERKKCLNSTNGVALMGLDSVILKQLDARNRHEELRRPWRSNGNETIQRAAWLLTFYTITDLFWFRSQIYLLMTSKIDQHDGNGRITRNFFHF